MSSSPDRRAEFSRWYPWGVLVGILFTSTTAVSMAVAEDKPVVHRAAEARNHFDEKGTYELVVRLTKDADTRKTYFLDSEEDYHDQDNLAILISYKDAEKFKKIGVDDPSKFYKGKTIRVTGKVILESGQTRIHVSEPAQIEVVPDSKPAAKS